jgi:hypothetical protein
MILSEVRLTAFEKWAQLYGTIMRIETKRWSAGLLPGTELWHAGKSMLTA